MSDLGAVNCILFVFAILAAGIVIGLLIAEDPLSAFYKDYFEQKQRNSGRDPREVLREEGLL